MKMKSRCQVRGCVVEWTYQWKHEVRAREDGRAVGTVQCREMDLKTHMKRSFPLSTRMETGTSWSSYLTKASSPFL